MPDEVDSSVRSEVDQVDEPVPAAARPTPLTAEIRRIYATIEREPEWYWRDAWLLTSVMLAGAGAGTDLADVLAATRQSSSPPAFMDRHQFGWAVSRLVGSTLLAECDHRFAPSAAATAMWARATAGRKPLSGAGLTRSLLRQMRSFEPEPADLSGWALSDDDYLAAVRPIAGQVMAE